MRIAAAGAMIAGFFMPWAGIWGLSLPGYRIPEIAGGLNQFSRALGGKGGSEVLLAYSVYLVPILALLTILDALSASPDPVRRKLLGLITGSMPFLGFAYALTQVGTDFLEIAAIGTYWTLTAAAALFAIALRSRSTDPGLRRDPVGATEVKPVPIEAWGHRVLREGDRWRCTICGGVKAERLEFRDLGCSRASRQGA